MTDRVLKVAVLAGDGIGQEVIPETLKVLEAATRGRGVRFEWRECLVGGASIDAHGLPLTDEVLETCRRSDAILLGAAGGPKWDDQPLALRPEKAVLSIRKTFGLFANLRPIWLPECLRHRTPLRPDLLEGGVDMLIVRELNFGLYFGERGRRPGPEGDIEAYDTCVYSEKAVEQVARVAFDAAGRRRKRLMSLDKSNVLETSRLWREVVIRVGADYPDIELRHQLIDSATMVVVQRPTELDVILANNEFGDIISDEASVLGGSLGMIPSAAIGPRPPFFYEPISGSAPDIAGQGIANPIGAILSGALMLRYSFEMEEAAAAVEQAVRRALEAGHRTRDIADRNEKSIGTQEMTRRIIEAL